MNRIAIAASLGIVLAVAAPARAQKPTKGTVAEARKLADAFTEVAERVSPSVVQIEVVQAVENAQATRGRGDGLHRGMGSGVMFTADGAVLTNNHVIEEARAIEVRLRDGRVVPCRLVGRDPMTDLAVLKVDAKNLPPPAKFADSGQARVGEWVIAIGSPFGLGYTVTTGVLSAKARGGIGIAAVEDYLQTDASINPGNSGGPLVNLDGEVIGINTMIIGRGQGIGLAVPANMAGRVAREILSNGHVDRAWLGVGIQDLTPQIASELAKAPNAGALVNSVDARGPASKSPLKPGDVITSIAGTDVHDAQDLIREVFGHRVGDSVKVLAVRGGKSIDATVKLVSRGDPPPPKLPFEKGLPAHAGLGFDAAIEGGVARIAAIEADGAADRAGLRPGDVVLELDGKTGPNADDIGQASQRGHALLRLRRGRAVFYVAIRK